VIDRVVERTADVHSSAPQAEWAEVGSTDL
jgi:hypothetical protein